MQDRQTMVSSELTSLVRRALQDEDATVIDCSSAPLDGGFSGAAVHRFTGQAETTQGQRAWSFIRKECNSANGNSDPKDYDYWKREILLYQSALLHNLPRMLIAPRCFAIEERSAQRAWLWLEDMGSQEHATQWPLAQYGVAARHLGQFNGAYLVGRPLSMHIWLRRPDVRERLALAAPGIDQLPTLRTYPNFAPLLTDEHMERIQWLWAKREQLLAMLEQLPLTFCHRDAFQHNLLLCHDGAGNQQTVALDWGSCGLGMLGEELVPLFSATLKFVVADPIRLQELDRTIFAGYMAGLRDAGWQGDEALVRFGFTALTALKAGVAEPATKMPHVARRSAALPPGGEAPMLLNPGGYAQAAAVSRYELTLGEEAWTLVHQRLR